jgi:hypothetical protein
MGLSRSDLNLEVARENSVILLEIILKKPTKDLIQTNQSR